MTMIRPAAAGISIVGRMLDSVSLKTCLAAILSVTAWHYTDAGDIKTLKQQNADQQSRIDFQRQELGKKIDRADYLADRKELHDDLREIRSGQQELNKILLERLH